MVPFAESPNGNKNLQFHWQGLYLKVDMILLYVEPDYVFFSFGEHDGGGWRNLARGNKLSAAPGIFSVLMCSGCLSFLARQ